MGAGGQEVLKTNHRIQRSSDAAPLVAGLCCAYAASPGTPPPSCSATSKLGSATISETSLVARSTVVCILLAWLQVLF